MNDAIRWMNQPPVRVLLPPAAVLRGQSNGEVTSPETLDFRTLRPIPGGLFCERIFGPLKDGECACGLYSGGLFVGQVCSQCGVAVTSSEVRNHWTGHIALFAPVCHPEFVRGRGQPVAHWCGLTQPELEGVVYYTRHIVLAVDGSEVRRQREGVLAAVRSSGVPEAPPPEVVEAALDQIESLAKWDVLTPEAAEPLRLLRKTLELALPGAFARMLDLRTGAEAVRTLLHSAGDPDRGRVVLDCLPVIPPGARAIRMLDERRVAIHEINDLYRRVINRNNRLRKLAEVAAPEAILDQEKRRLQESVDALIDNTHSPEPFLNSRGRPLRCLADLEAS